MSAAELGEFQDRMLRRILCLNGLWFLFVVIVMFWSIHIGLIFVIITAVKYWYDYNDTESLTVYDSILSVISRMGAEKSEDGNSDN
jgi:TM2 domain-containing membrane protein YozV